jgi:hypothetical protein
MVLGAFAAACSDSPSEPTDTIPRVELLPSASAPSAPAGNVARCYTDLNGVTISQTCPVVKWNDVTYWVFEYEDQRNSVNLVAYSTNQDIITQSERVGTRQIYEITVSEEFETIRIFGKDAIPAIVPWSVLEAAQPGG